MLTMQTDEFLEAIRKNDNPKILQLLKTQPSLADTREPGGVSAIFLALYRGNKQAAQEIASRRSSLDIFEAAALGSVGNLKRLLDHDKSLVFSYSPDGFTALGLAAYLGQKESVEYLIDKGADLNALAKNETGYTALTGAVSQNHNDIARLLVNRGANVNHGYEGGFTPLMHAAYAGNLELVNLLLEHGADPNAKNAEGKTPLTFARENGHAKLAELLKSHGAT
jgi:uncharacterized protein